MVCLSFRQVYRSVNEKFGLTNVPGPTVFTSILAAAAFCTVDLTSHSSSLH